MQPQQYDNLIVIHLLMGRRATSYAQHRDIVYPYRTCCKDATLSSCRRKQVQRRGPVCNGGPDRLRNSCPDPGPVRPKDVRRLPWLRRHVASLRCRPEWCLRGDGLCDPLPYCYLNGQARGKTTCPELDSVLLTTQQLRQPSRGNPEEQFCKEKQTSHLLPFH